MHAGEDESAGGGTRVGDVGVWIGDHTMRPENGGLGVHAHEYGHDPCLPDEYGTVNGEAIP